MEKIQGYAPHNQKIGKTPKMLNVNNENNKIDKF